MEVDERIVGEIVRRILSVCAPDRIILFGSAAAGKMTRDSDIDLLVLEENPGDTREESVRIGEALRGLGFPFDIIVMPRDRFEESKGVIGGIAYPANKYGKVIYEAA
jgi:uncharacterized protein